DTYFDPTGADGNVLSLGLYRERARAEALRNQIAAAGFQPVLVDRTRSATVFWADFESAEQLDPDLSSLQGASPVVSVQVRYCESIGFAAG
ncbi:MAG TPA: SPOR domain-containing protein, partial [Gammaproteobacteria bacterium]